jgi:tRNA-splicing ligase RtcB
MPDAHVGAGSTIGSVIPTSGAIIPAAVGVDIGCGMIAAEMPFTSDLLGDDLNKLHEHIAQVVPSGVGKGHEVGSGRRTADQKRFPSEDNLATELDQKLRARAYTQFGSLGSGNHFVEVCVDERDIVWVVLHSGSRGVGNKLAQMHIETAKGLMKHLDVRLEDPDLAYLMEGTEEFTAYIKDMHWAQLYALGNREVMMDAVLRQMAGHVGNEFQEVSRVNCHHNYTTREFHNEQEIWVTRKGAVRAGLDDIGVIPGSMGTSSYIVRGLGNPLSYNSCAHGAGRKMSRGQARRTLDQETFTKSMEGIVWNKNAKGLLDEDPRSYKDIDQVMEDQKDLVVIEHILHQVLNYKGE